MRGAAGSPRVAAPVGVGQRSGLAGRLKSVGVRVRYGVGEGPWALRCSLEGRDPGLGLGRG